MLLRGLFLRCSVFLFSGRTDGQCEIKDHLSPGSGGSIVNTVILFVTYSMVPSLDSF